MARAIKTDFFHTFKFHLKVVSATTEGGKTVGTQGGFTSVTMPEITVETAEYQEGTMLYKRKFPGQVSFSDVSCNRGVVRGNTELYEWVRAAYLGKEYRADVQISHMHRDEVTDLADFTAVDAKRNVKLFEGMASRVKLGSDFDAQSSDVSVEEFDIVYEYATLENPAAT